jgi:nucleotide-binding universal stress UspA family protein
MDVDRAEGSSLTDGDRPLTKVLAGVDGSERSLEAARQAARLAHAVGAPLEVVFVVDTGRPHRDDVEVEAEAALERAAALGAEAGVTVDTRILAGDPARTLLEEAEEEGADLVCVGPDAGLIGGAVRIGQVAAHVLREAGSSVLVARPVSAAFPERVACGVDGSEASGETAALAAGIALAAGAELRLVHVIPVFRGHDSEWTLGDAEASPEELEPAVAAATARGVVPVREMAMGRPEHALVKVAGRDGTDLLVVGHRGVSGVRRMLLGSVSEYCAHHAPCSVLVARPGRAERGT